MCAHTENGDLVWHWHVYGWWAQASDFARQRLHPCSGGLSFGALGLETTPADERHDSCWVEPEHSSVMPALLQLYVSVITSPTILAVLAAWLSGWPRSICLSARHFGLSGYGFPHSLRRMNSPGWVFATDIHGADRMNPDDSGEPLTIQSFHLLRRYLSIQSLYRRRVKGVIRREEQIIIPPLTHRSQIICFKTAEPRKHLPDMLLHWCERTAEVHECSNQYWIQEHIKRHSKKDIKLSHLVKCSGKMSSLATRHDTLDRARKELGLWNYGHAQ